MYWLQSYKFRGKEKNLMDANRLNSDQTRVANTLAKTYGIDPGRVFFPDETNPSKPWLGADELMLIARKSDQIKVIEECFDTFIQALNQIVHTARIVDKEGREYSRVGVATIGEKVGAGDGDAHALAASRALVSTLSAAGLNPLRDGGDTTFKPIASSDAKISDAQPVSGRVAEAKQRNNDMARIHILAEQAGLITREDGSLDATAYRGWLLETFNLNSSVAADAATRASIINAIEQMVIERN
jgi:hypothetical protein